MNKYPSEFNRKQNAPEYWAEKIIGNQGRMVGGSKSIYSYDHPKNLILFNANIATKENGKIWYGDLDISLDFEKLKNLQETIGDFYVFYESSLRFDKENEPIDFKEAFCFFNKEGFGTEKSLNYKKDKQGVPFLVKEKIKKEIETQMSSFESLEKDFQEIKIPEIKKLKVKKGESAWIKFQEELIELYGKEKSLEIYMKLYLSKEDSDQIDKLNRQSIKKQYKYLHKVKVDQSVSMDSLSHGCLEFNPSPSWVKPGFGYIKKAKE